MVNNPRTSAKVFGLLLLALCAVVCLPRATLAQDFIIERFHADIAIQENSDVVITETIEVDFNRQKHGIYREIPFKYVDELGRSFRMPLSVLDVTDEDQRARTNRVTRQGNVVNIRIGHPDRYVSGRQVYVITYKVENSLLFFDNYDEFYWNVTGNYWDADILSASARVTFDTPDKSTNFRQACYTGFRGSSATDCESLIQAGGVDFATTGELSAGEGLTIALGFDKGIVSEPSSWQKFLWSINIRDNWILILPVFVFFFIFFRWWKYGRDPKVREALVVQYSPPTIDGHELTAAEAGTLIDERLDQRDISASLIGLASKGYLKIVEKEESYLMGLFTSKDYELHRLKEVDPDLTPFEATLLHLLFGTTGDIVAVSSLKNKFYRYLPQLHKALYSELVRRKYFTRSPEKTRGHYVLLGILVLVIGGVLTLVLQLGEPIRGIIASVISAGIIFAFANAMPAKTRLGSQAHMDVLGFQEFMERADKDRIKRLGKEGFYKYLPYAIALDVVDLWARAFDGMFDEPPSWYVSAHGFTNFSPSVFSKTINATTSHLGSTMFSAPRSSGSGGSGGGGSSGGGGGGGGGGSW